MAQQGHEGNEGVLNTVDGLNPDASGERVSHQRAAPRASGAVRSAGVGKAFDAGRAALAAGHHGGVNGAMADNAASAHPDPTGEDAYWRDNFRKRPYADETLSYDHYRPAYRYGWESRTRLEGQRWDQVEKDLERGWRENRGASRLGWTDAKLAARDAWQRVDHRIADERDLASTNGNLPDPAR